MRQLQVVLTIIWLVSCVGCGSSNQSAPTLNAAGTIAGPTTATATNSVIRAIGEVPVKHNRTEETTVTFPNLNLQSSTNYLLVGVENNSGTESYRLMLPQTATANTVTTSYFAS